MKTIGGLRKLRHRGGARVDWQFVFTAAVYNLVRMRNLGGNLREQPDVQCPDSSARLVADRFAVRHVDMSPVTPRIVARSAADGPA
jgi:hypothetical protein